jgi:hypothetical protein
VAITDNERMKSKKKNIRAVVTKSNHSWGDKQKVEAVQSYLLLGNLALSSRILGIPEVTLRVWKASTWWKDLVEDIKMQENMQMSGRLKKIVDASLIAVEDRLLNGDLVYDQKSGEMRRKAVNMKDAHKVAIDLMEKREHLDKKAINGPVEEQNDEKLLKLAEKFAAFVTNKIEQKEVLEMVEDITDIEVNDNALHDQRQTGLQEREPTIQLEAGTNQGEVRTDSVAPGSQ